MEVTLLPDPERRQSRLGRMKDALLFRLVPPNWESVLTSRLAFGDEANERFLEGVRLCSSFLEYGSGSSTLVAVERVDTVTSVDSDARFLEAVAHLSAPNEPRLLYADVGRTGPWGVPRRRRPTDQRVASWASYPLKPWLALGESFRADLILIDGRFRVACALAVVLKQPDTQWTMLFDDYAGRPEYWAIEDFADLLGLHGRMAEFGPRSGVHPDQVRDALAVHARDWR